MQTRLHNPPESKGNCFPAVIASIMNLFSAEDAIQIQEQYDNPEWPGILDDWLRDHGFEWERIDGHLHNDEYYLVVGDSHRGVSHVCIYKNGRLYHDPHPDQTGLINEKGFETITYIGNHRNVLWNTTPTLHQQTSLKS